MKRIYLASRFERQEELRAIAELMTAEGWVVTSRWLMHTGGLSVGPGKEPVIAAEWAQKDLEDVESSDTLVLFTDDNPTSRDGSNVEFGYAIGRGLRCIVVGPRVNVFHYYNGVIWIPTLAEFRELFCGCQKVSEIGET